MMKQIKILAKLELCNLYGLNVFRFSKDKKAKKKSRGLLAAYMTLVAALAFYMGGLSYGLIYLGLEEAVPAYLITISSLMLFLFGILKAGGGIFRKEGYDMLCALPVSKAAIVGGRLFRMYAENLLGALVLVLPGISVYAWNVRPGARFYLAALLGTCSIPLIPLTGAILLGALIAGISSRMRHKSLTAAGLSILAVLAVMYVLSKFSAMDGGMDPEAFKEIAASLMDLLGKVYPPAVSLGTAVVRGDLPRCLLCVSLSSAVFVTAAAGVILCFEGIYNSLYSNPAKHNYEVGGLKTNSIYISLCKREFRRYFSSSIYVANTIIGPIMGCVLSGALLTAGTGTLEELLPFSIDIASLAPFLLAGAFCMMTTTATSISMEGKSWWVVRSLPLSVKSILDAKILMNLLLLLPFYILSEILLIFALKPRIGQLFWMTVIPIVIILFSCVYGITINLRFPVLEWESEMSVVKQSASSLLGGMGGFVLGMVCAVSVGLAAGEYVGFLKAGLCAAILSATAYLYRKNNNADEKPGNALFT